MKLHLEITEERSAHLTINAEELARVHLHLASPGQRNRTDRYLRRHAIGPAETATPNRPARSPEEPPKLAIPAHLAEMRRDGLLPAATPPITEGTSRFRLEPTMIAVSISDLVANLLRPSYHRSGLGSHRLFYFEGEPVERSRGYFCACCFDAEGGHGRLELRRIHFDPHRDGIREIAGTSGLQADQLIWAAAVIPLIESGRPLAPWEIARDDYDLRQILGRGAEAEIQDAYLGWYGEWESSVERIVREYIAEGRTPATFYHSVLAFDRNRNVHIYQKEASLPDLAASLIDEGMVSAALLDSGGSCAIYDANIAAYLNHGWYFREPRGAILVFQLTTHQKLPESAHDSWARRREEDRSCMP